MHQLSIEARLARSGTTDGANRTAAGSVSTYSATSVDTVMTTSTPSLTTIDPHMQEYNEGKGAYKYAPPFLASSLFGGGLTRPKVILVTDPSNIRNPGASTHVEYVYKVVHSRVTFSRRLAKLIEARKRFDENYACVETHTVSYDFDCMGCLNRLSLT